MKFIKINFLSGIRTCPFIIIITTPYISDRRIRPGNGSNCATSQQVALDQLIFTINISVNIGESQMVPIVTRVTFAGIIDLSVNNDGTYYKNNCKTKLKYYQDLSYAD